MTERNTDNSDARQSAVNATAGVGMGAGQPDAGSLVQAQIEANERARKMLEEGQGSTTADAGAVVQTNASVPAGAIVTEEKPKKTARAKKGSKKANEDAQHEPQGMAAVNLAWKRNALQKSFKKYKKVWIGAGVALAVLVLVIVGVVVGVNSDSGCDGGSPTVGVLLDYSPDGYGDEVPGSVVVSVFNDAIEEKLKNDDTYTFEDAVLDYENAYVEGEADIQLDILISYANFIFTETGNANAAVETLLAVADLVTEENDILKFYTAIVNIYNKDASFGQANYYRGIMDSLIESQEVPLDEILQ